MKFIVDAQLPFRLKRWLIDQGVDCIHTDDLPLKEETPDTDIIKLAVAEDGIVISKDSDFFKYNLLHGKPRRVLMVATGNIINRDLIRLFEVNFPTIKSLFEEGTEVLEINNDSIIAHK